MTFFQHYWWPSIQGNGPEDLTSLIFVGVLGGIFLPKIRRWAVRIHTKLDHIIEHHPDIPTVDRNGNSLIGDK